MFTKVNDFYSALECNNLNNVNGDHNRIHCKIFVKNTCVKCINIIYLFR